MRCTYCKKELTRKWLGPQTGILWDISVPNMDAPGCCADCGAGREVCVPCSYQMKMTVHKPIGGDCLLCHTEKPDLTKLINMKHALAEVSKVMAEGDGREGRDRDDWKEKPADYFTPKLLRHTVTVVQEGHGHVDTDSQCKTLAHIAALALYALENELNTTRGAT